jgi:GR25 family glycosyltransferase involved in LPS biosynthesis
MAASDLHCYWIVDRSTDIKNIQTMLQVNGISKYEMYFASTTDKDLNGHDHFQIAAEVGKSDSPYIAVFDRNVQFSDDFAGQFNNVHSIISTLSDWDIIYLDHRRQDHVSDVPNARSLVRKNHEWSSAYLLSRQGAEKICNYIEILPPNLVISHELAILNIIPDFVSYHVKNGLISKSATVAATATVATATRSAPDPIGRPVQAPKNLKMSIEKETEAPIVEAKIVDSERQAIKKQVLGQIPTDVPDATVEKLVDNIINQRKAPTVVPTATVVAPVPTATVVAPVPTTTVAPPQIYSRFKLVCINLERRPDRKLEFIKKMHDAQIDTVEFVNGIDGLNIKPSPELVLMIKNNTFGGRRGVIGKAMSHIGIWNKLVLDDTSDFYVVFEDDAQLTENFKDKLTSVMRGLVQIADFEVVWLGYNNDGTMITNTAITDMSSKQIRVQYLNKTVRKSGTFGYIIHKRGAQKYVDNIKANGITHSIDMLMTDDKLNVSHFELNPPIVVASTNDDSDVRDVRDGKVL